EVRKVPTKRVDETQAGNGNAPRARHSDAVSGGDPIHDPQQVTDGLGSRNVLRHLDSEPVLEFEQQFEQQKGIDLELLERGLVSHSGGIDVFGLVQEFTEDIQEVLFHVTIFVVSGLYVL